MTGIEIIVWVLIIATAIKLIAIAVSPKGYISFAKSIYANPKVVKFVALILSGVVLYYLLFELTIVQIIASGAFIILILVIGLASEMPYFMKKAETLINKGNIWKEYWLYTLIWIILLGWALRELIV